ncbi:MAG: DUF169 domain-containing protein [Thermodesulfobacteriota bacterium]
MENWIALNEGLKRYINPATFPVAISFLKQESEIPPRARRPKRDLSVTLAPCQGAAMARRYGWTVAFAKEDVGCAIAANSYGWERISGESQAEGVVTFLTYMNYAGSPEAAREVLKGFRLLEAGEDLIVVYAPLVKTKINPDIVLIYVNPAQLMRLIHGATQATGKAVEGSFSGRAASCTEGVIGAFLDQRPKVVVPGNGDRVWGGCQDHEMAFALPGHQLEGLVEGLQKTHEKGIRYPIPTYLRYQPEVAFSIPLSDIFKPELQAKLKK